jgi:tetratricopeptide (TPR) repeat protein
VRLNTTRMAGAVAALAVGLVATRAQAQLAPPVQTAAPSAADKLASQSAEAELSGDHAKALDLADQAINADAKNPWGYYDRGDALGALHRMDDAMAAFRDAERRCSDSDVWGKSVAIWAQANVLSQVGRCDEALAIFERYASFVEKVDSAAAALARLYGKQCTRRPAAH